MSELLPAHEALWFKGPNYTADAVVIDEQQQKIVLVLRPSGEWALPGGFVDEGETSYEAAQREAREESTIDIMNGQLVFGGIVDDPRNTDQSWIETDAYVFLASSDTTTVRANNETRDAKWHPLDNLPPLYASHQSIIDRTIDYLRSAHQLAQIPTSLTPVAVDGGHMNYAKNMIITPDQSLFIKSYEGGGDVDWHMSALHKESAIMGHLRTSHYPHLPAFSHATGPDLFMQALPPDYGWYWRAPKQMIDAYIRDCLDAFTTLEQMPVPADITNIPSTMNAHRSEGWQTFDDDRLSMLTDFVDQQTSRLRPASQKTARRLLADIPRLQRIAKDNPLPDSFVFCHHDARQANIAWHPEHGVRIVDWNWADIGRPGSDATMLLVDLHKHGHDISAYHHAISTEHCVTLIGFWLYHALQPIGEREPSIRLHQFISALSAYEVLTD